MKKLEVDPKEWQFGQTKLFIKSPETLFMMEELRQRRYHSFAVRIQRAYRSWKSRKYFIDLRAKSQDILYGKKERKRISLRRDYIGDYIGYLDNAALRTLMGKNMQVLFADNIIKYDRRFNAQPRTLLMTSKQVNIIALEKMKEGPNKGKDMHIFKRQINITAITGITVSTMCDDYVVLHVPSDYDSVIETVFKTELVILLIEKAEEVGHNIRLDFSDTITYQIKKGKKAKITFIKDPSMRIPTMKKGVVRVPEGLPKDSRNIGQAHQAASVTQSRPRAAHSASGPGPSSSSSSAAVSSRVPRGADTGSVSVASALGITSSSAAWPSTLSSSSPASSSGGVAIRKPANIGMAAPAVPVPPSTSSSSSVRVGVRVGAGLQSNPSASVAMRGPSGASASASSFGVNEDAMASGLRVPAPVNGSGSKVGARVGVAVKGPSTPQAPPPPHFSESEVPARAAPSATKPKTAAASRPNPAAKAPAATFSGLPRPPAAQRRAHAGEEDDASSKGDGSDWGDDDPEPVRPPPALSKGRPSNVAAKPQMPKLPIGMMHRADDEASNNSQDDEWGDEAPAPRYPMASKPPMAPTTSKPPMAPTAYKPPMAPTASKPPMVPTTAKPPSATTAPKPSPNATKPVAGMAQTSRPSPAAAASRLAAVPLPKQPVPESDDDWDTDDAAAPAPAPAPFKVAPKPAAAKPTNLPPKPATPVAPPRPQAPAKPKLPQCRAVYRYVATQPDELNLQPGDIVTINKKNTDDDWWEGTCKGKKGVFPSNYVQEI
jgi:hypothetical protein